MYVVHTPIGQTMLPLHTVCFSAALTISVDGKRVLAAAGFGAKRGRDDVLVFKSSHFTFGDAFNLSSKILSDNYNLTAAANLAHCVCALLEHKFALCTSGVPLGAGDGGTRRDSVHTQCSDADLMGSQSLVHHDSLAQKRPPGQAGGPQ